MADQTTRLRVILESQSNQFAQDMGAVRGQVDATKKSVEALNNTGFSGLSDKIENLAGFFSTLKDVTVGLYDVIQHNPLIAAAQQFETYGAQLKSLTGSVGAARAELGKLADYAASTPFDLPGLVEADIQLRSFQVSVERFLPVAATLAAVSGRTVADAATALGKALSGIPEGLTQLQESFRLTRADLVHFGAEADKTGAILTKTVAQQEKLANAVERASKIKFPGIIAEQANTITGAFSNLEDAVTRLKASLGESLLPTIITFVGIISNMIDAFNKLDPSTKQLIAQFALAAAVIVPVAGALTTVIGALGLLAPAVATAITEVSVLGAAATAITGAFESLVIGATTVVSIFEAFGAAGGAAIIATEGLTAISGAAVAAAAALGPVGLVLAAVALAAAGLAAYTKGRVDSNTIAEQTLAIELKLADAYRLQHGLLGLTIAQLKERGATDVQITEAIIGAENLANEERERAKRLESEGATEAAKAANAKADQLQKQADDLRKSRTQFAGTEAAKQAAVEDTKKAQLEAADSATKAFTDYTKSVSEHVYTTKREQLAAADAVEQATLASLNSLKSQLEALEKAGKGENQGSDDDKARFTKLDKRIKEQEANEKQLHDARIDLAHDAAEEETRIAKQAIDQQVTLAQISKTQQAKLLEELAAKQKTGSDEQIALQYEAQRVAVEAQKEIKNAVLATHEVEVQAYTEKEAFYKDNLQQGLNIAANEKLLKETISARYKLEIQDLKDKAELQKADIGDSQVKAEIDKQTADQVSILLQKQKKELLDAAAAGHAARAKEIADAQALIQAEQELANARLTSAQKKFDREGTGGKDILAEEKAIQRREETLINSERKQRLEANLTATQRFQINKEADDKIAASRIAYADKVDDEERKQAQRKAQDRLKDIEIDKRASDAKIDALREEAEFSDRAARELILAEEAAFALTEKRIKAQLEVDTATVGEVQKKQLIRQADLDIEAARRSSIKTVEGLNAQYTAGADALQKQRDIIAGIDSDLKKLKAERDKREGKNQEEDVSQLSTAELEYRIWKRDHEAAEAKKKAERIKAREDAKEQDKLDAAAAREANPDLTAGEAAVKVQKDKAEKANAEQEAAIKKRNEFFNRKKKEDEAAKDKDKGPSAKDESELGKDKVHPVPVDKTGKAGAGATLDDILAALNKQTALYQSLTGGGSSSQGFNDKGLGGFGYGNFDQAPKPAGTV